MNSPFWTGVGICILFFFLEVLIGGFIKFDDPSEYIIFIIPLLAGLIAGCTVIIVNRLNEINKKLDESREQDKITLL